MNTPFVTSVVRLYDEFKKYAGSDEIAKGEEVDDFVKNNFRELLENPLDPETATKLLNKVKAHRDSGITIDIYTLLICDFIHAYAKGLIGLKKN